MLYIIWSDKSNLGIPIIDEQHRGIVSIINTFHYFVQQGHGPETLRPTLSMIERFSELHFETEEALMTEADYQGLDDHIILHRSLLNETRSIRLEVAQSGDAEAALKFLREWWLHHINVEDRKYAPFVLERLGTANQ